MIIFKESTLGDILRSAISPPLPAGFSLSVDFDYESLYGTPYFYQKYLPLVA